MFKSENLSERMGLPFEKEVGSYLRRHDSAKLSPLVEPTRVTDSIADKLRRFKVRTKRETAAILAPLKSRSKFDSALGGYLKRVDPSSTEVRLASKDEEENSIFGWSLSPSFKNRQISNSSTALGFNSRADLQSQKQKSASKSSYGTLLRQPRSKYEHSFVDLDQAKKNKEVQMAQPMRVMELVSKFEKAIKIPRISVPAIVHAKPSMKLEKNIIGAKYEDKNKPKMCYPEILDIPVQKTDGERQIFDEEKPVLQKGLLREKPFKKSNESGAIKKWMVSELKEVYKE